MPCRPTARPTPDLLAPRIAPASRLGFASGDTNPQFAANLKMLRRLTLRDDFAGVYLDLP